MLLRLRSKAFTLLELIVVVVILAVLAALAIPTFSQVIDKSKDAVAGASLSSVARNAQAIRAISGTLGFTYEHVSSSVEETSSSQAYAGNWAAGRFVMAEGSSSVTAGSGGTSSTRFGEVAWSLSADSSTVGLAMKSTTERCVYVKTVGNSSTRWAVSVTKPATCDASEALLISGPDGGTHNPGTGPGEVGGEGTLLDPSNPETYAPGNDLASTGGEYCEENNCAAPLLLNATTLAVKTLTPGARYDDWNSVVVDSVNKRLIASKSDGIYFVDWTTGNATLAVAANDEQFRDLIYFKPGILFARTQASGGPIYRFNVTSGGLTLTSSDLMAATPSVTEYGTYSPNANLLAGDVVGGGARLYLGEMSNTTNIFNNSEWFGEDNFWGGSYIGKTDIEGNLAKKPMAFWAASSNLRLCGMSADQNWLYLNMCTYNDDAKGGVYRLDKDASGVNLGDLTPWKTLGGLATSGGSSSSSISAIGEKVIVSDGLGLLSLSRANANAASLIGEGNIGTDYLTDGVGVSATLSSVGYLTGLTTYKDRVYMVDGGKIRVAGPAAEVLNEWENTPFTLKEGAGAKTLFTGEYYSDMPTLDPEASRLFFTDGGVGRIYDLKTETVGPQLPVYGREGGISWHQERLAAAGGYTYLGDGEDSSFWRTPNRGYGNGCVRNYSAKYTYDAKGKQWCLEDGALTDYSIPALGVKHTISFPAGLTLGNVEKVSVNSRAGTLVIVTREKQTSSATYKVYKGSYQEGTLSLVGTLEYAVNLDVSDFGYGTRTIAVASNAVLLPVSNGVVSLNLTTGTTEQVVTLDPAATTTFVTGVAHQGDKLFYTTGGPNGTVVEVS